MKESDFLAMLLDFFEVYLPKTKGVSSNTIRSYKAAFRLFFEFMKERKHLDPNKVRFSGVTGSIIDEYLQWLEDDRGCSRKTRNQRLAALSSFAKYAMRQDAIVAGRFSSVVLGTPKKRVPPQNIDDVVFFWPDELHIILNLPNRETVSGRRDVVLMSMLYASGARAQEICDLTVNDITFGEETRVRLIGKGNKARRIIIPKECGDLLKVHMKQTGLLTAERTRHVFSSQRSEHMTISCVEELVAKYVSMAKTRYPEKFKFAKYTPHSFRHTIAVDMLASGCSLPAIKSFLGHVSIKSTMIYATVTSEQANKTLREHGLPLQLPNLTIERNDAEDDSLWFLR